MQQRVLWGPLLAAGLVGGCAHHASVTLGPEYFKHNESGYELIYAGDGPEQALGPDYRLDNYRLAPAHGGKSAYFMSQEGGYGFQRGYDVDGDGLPDVRVAEPVYDLRFVQKQGAGEIWLRSITLADSLKGKSLEVLLRRYVQKLPRTALPFDHFGEGLPTGVARPTWQVGTRAEQTCQVANVPAQRVDIDLRDLAGGAPTRASLVLMRPGYTHTLDVNTTKYSYEVVLLAAYVNREDAFEQGEPAFDGMLDRLSLAHGQAPHTCRGAAPEASDAP